MSGPVYLTNGVPVGGTVNPNGQMLAPMKSVGEAYMYFFSRGIFGQHQLYLGHIARGMLYRFTLGLFGMGLLWDLFTLSGQVKKVNQQIAAGARIG